MDGRGPPPSAVRCIAELCFLAPCSLRLLVAAFCRQLSGAGPPALCTSLPRASSPWGLRPRLSSAGICQEQREACN